MAADGLQGSFCARSGDLDLGTCGDLYKLLIGALEFPEMFLILDGSRTEASARSGMADCGAETCKPPIDQHDPYFYIMWAVVISYSKEQSFQSVKSSSNLRSAVIVTFSRMKDYCMDGLSCGILLSGPYKGPAGVHLLSARIVMLC